MVRELSYSEDRAYRRLSAMRLSRELPEISEKIRAGSLSLTNLSRAASVFRKERPSREEKLAVLSALENKSLKRAQKILALAPTVRLEVGTETLAKLERLAGLRAVSLTEVVDQLAELGLKQWDPAREPSRAIQKRCVTNTRREVWRRDGCRCTNCGSTFALEIDHIKPRALGGSDELTNLRLLCRSCNQRAGIEKLGRRKMEFREKPRA